MKKVAPESDNIITPDWTAKDMVQFYQPSGYILDPSAGDGVFLRYLPNADWCEIKKGRDFFDWTKQVDWVFGNPPYSIFRHWLKHSYEIAINIVYLIPSFLIFNPLSCLRMMRNNGMPVHIRVYDVGRKIEWSRSRQIYAVHLRRGYLGPTTWSFYDTPNQSLEADDQKDGHRSA